MFQHSKLYIWYLPETKDTCALYILKFYYLVILNYYEENIILMLHYFVS